MKQDHLPHEVALIARLKRFYGVQTLFEVAAQQDRHIMKLQERLQRYEEQQQAQVPFPRTPREG